MKTPKPAKLPNKLSDLILVALTDLGKAERSKLYKVDMGVWHEPNSHCSACFGGSVMAFTLKESPYRSLFPEAFAGFTKRKLRALDYARRGSFRSAAALLGASVFRQNLAAQVRDEINIISYHNNRNRFKRSMRKAARKLAEVGL